MTEAHGLLMFTGLENEGSRTCLTILMRLERGE